ncbi:TetR/AcrR family transcriptional regulator [Alkalibacter mobilis]|uniref:TetR/AcrR family transcriptional regulator n=1 Tax=Alkalibacter mobilis TaxID=2787712 RepID=UPI00189F340C|nr:TetR/AcrR family transcriptional regulator [Alkalibacter mobilis]MBF7097698.1 TetR/AcrR family transcriptional regulator [Alkalibacter mobilis]
MENKKTSKKDIIYRNAKILLYEEGYANCTIKKIADKSNVPVSLVHYYFKKKEEIIRSIYHDFLNDIEFFLYRNKPEIFSNSILSHAVTSRIYYHIILTNPNNRRVYLEVMKHGSNYRILNKYTTKTYYKYVEDNNVIISKELFDAYVLMDFGARREFLLQYFDGNINLSIHDIVSTLNGLIPRMLKLNQHFIDSMFMDSISIYNSLDYSDLKFLI